jgi:hypothetical protein
MDPVILQYIIKLCSMALGSKFSRLVSITEKVLSHRQHHILQEYGVYKHCISSLRHTTVDGDAEYMTSQTLVTVSCT